MNWLSIVILAFLILIIANGIRRGLVKTVLSMLSILLAIALASAFSPYIEGFLKEKTPLYDSIQQSSQKKLAESLENQEGTDLTEQISRLEELPLPGDLIDSILESYGEKEYDQLIGETLADYLSAAIASVIVNGVAGFLSFTLAMVLIRILIFALDRAVSLPVIKTFNRIGGGMAGAVQGLLVIWIAFLAVTLLYSTAWAKEGYRLIREDTFLTFLYNNNILLQLLNNLVGF
jgi:uncharacterized membrane protein required for colicin V production